MFVRRSYFKFAMSNGFIYFFLRGSYEDGLDYEPSEEDRAPSPNRDQENAEEGEIMSEEPSTSRKSKKRKKSLSRSSSRSSSPQKPKQYKDDSASDSSSDR